MTRIHQQRGIKLSALFADECCHPDCERPSAKFVECPVPLCEKHMMQVAKAVIGANRTDRAAIHQASMVEESKNQCPRCELRMTLMTTETGVICTQLNPRAAPNRQRDQCLVAQLAELPIVDRLVAGSIPAGVAIRCNVKPRLVGVSASKTSPESGRRQLRCIGLNDIGGKR